MFGNSKTYTQEKKYLFLFTLCTFFLFFIITYLYLTTHNKDAFITTYIFYPFRSITPFFSLLSLALAYVTQPLFSLLYIFILILPFILAKKIRIIIGFILSLFVSGIVGIIIKAYTHIPRPVDSLLLVSGSSFPSIHALLSWACASSLVLWLSDENDHSLSQHYVLFIKIMSILGACVLSLSRVVIHVHTGTDIVVGALLGISISSTIYLLLKRE